MNGNLLRVRYDTAHDRGTPQCTRERHRPSQRKMPEPLPAWLKPPKLVNVHVYNHDGTQTRRTRVVRLHELPSLPPWDGQTWILRVARVWVAHVTAEVIAKGYKAMWRP